MSIKLTDMVAVLIANSGGRFEYIPLTDFNTLISAEEDSRLTALEDANTVTVVDLTAGSGDYQIDASGVYVFTDNKETAVDVLLPEATAGSVGMRIIVSNQDNVDLDVVPFGTETINGANTPETLATTESVTLICYAVGKWAIV